MIELVDLSKNYRQTEAVKKVNIFIERGEIVGLLGPNGAGKSTVISMLASLLEPTSGDVRFNKKSMLRDPAPLRKTIGMVPQDIALYEDLTAEENLQFFGRIYQLKGKDLKRRVQEILEQIDLADKRKERVKRFSGGMKRRLNIGVAMLHEPEMIIMDEPTVGIDPQSRNYILETVKKLNEENKMTVLYTSHYMEEVEFLCDRIYIMDKGNLIASGTKEEIKNIISLETAISIEADHWNDTFVKRIKESPFIHRIHIREKEITLIIPREVNLFSTIIKIAEDTGQELNSVNRKEPSLEDVFLHLTGRALRD